MSTDTDVFDDVLDERTKGQAEYGVPLEKKRHLKNIETTTARLDHLGVRVPHEDFSPEDAHAYPTTVVVTDDDGHEERLHLYQSCTERSSDFGSFGAAEDDTDDVTWTAVDLVGDVTLTVVGEWSRRRTVDPVGFLDEYELLTTVDGRPRRDY